MTPNPFAGKPLRYLIGADSEDMVIARDAVTVVPFDYEWPIRDPWVIGYGNLFDEENGGKYGPYLPDTDTSAQYDEGHIDPRGPGWLRNLRDQFTLRSRQGFKYIELDNADAYSIADVIGAIELAASYGLKVIAKNPMLLEGETHHLAHPNIYGAIVEKDCGRPKEMDEVRRQVGKPDLPVWFVAFGRGKAWAEHVAKECRLYRNMGVTWSRREYDTSEDILRPHA